MGGALRLIPIVWVAAVHILLLLTSAFAIRLWSEVRAQDENWFRRVHAFHLRAEANLGPNGVYLVGDSHVQGLCASCVDPRAVNFGIGKDTVEGAHRRIIAYRNLHLAELLMLQIGHNDLKASANEQIVRDYEALLADLPVGLPVVLMAQVRLSKVAADWSRINERKREIDLAVSGLCSERNACRFLDLSEATVDSDGALRAELAMSDGVHLSPLGYEIWIGLLRKEFALMRLEQL